MINITVTWWDINVDISWAIQKSLYQSVNTIRNKAIDNAPYLTWNLRRSITTKVLQDKWLVWTNVKYAKIREFYNRKNPHTKFYMKRAMNDSLVMIQWYFNYNIKKAIWDM